MRCAAERCNQGAVEKHCTRSVCGYESESAISYRDLHRPMAEPLEIMYAGDEPKAEASPNEPDDFLTWEWVEKQFARVPGSVLWIGVAVAAAGMVWLIAAGL